MKYHLAADGGGTKLLAVLYDEELNIVNTARTFGVNSNFKPKEQVEEEVYRMVEELLPDTITQIESVDMSWRSHELSAHMVYRQILLPSALLPASLCLHLSR